MLKMGREGWIKSPNVFKHNSLLLLEKSLYPFVPAMSVFA